MEIVEYDCYLDTVSIAQELNIAQEIVRNHLRKYQAKEVVLESKWAGANGS